MTRLRVLLVEDDAIISALIVEFLADLGYDVCATAQTEREAVAAAERHAPDLMIVDVGLRAGGGVAAMAAILQRIAMPHIFMTGGTRHGIPPDATVLRKPFNSASLKAAVARVALTIAAPDHGD